MSDIDFYVLAALRREVLGVSLGATPEAWQARLGDDFLDDVRKGRMRRDYGLVEIAFSRDSGIWAAVTVSLQVHRLARGLERVVPPALERAHGGSAAGSLWSIVL
ncbi:hypothetical protein C3489_19945 [Streptomyces sp. Ru71]|uniref:hypothetical protein n=1 Tax=Streptomyces sp. Ru71 TaxID=2080746 RepID=UPI000CDE36D9|nr:hypothetical protein [Streptomyces sp. Ru71]POX51506.1 hypothetical protein C3489_19945 [Streptomyces sp. Ru71]